MKENISSQGKFTTKDFVLCGVLMALTTVMTLLVQIPVVGTQGYVNMGDSIVLFSAMYLGKKYGAVIGGVGSAIADLVSGYAIYAPITLVTKGLEGFICGLIVEKIPGNKGRLIGTIIGGIIMVSGYFIAEIYLYGIKASAAAILPNSMQAIFGIVSALIIYASIKKIKL